MIILVTPTMQTAKVWCKNQEPRINPGDRQICIITAAWDAELRLRGRRLRSEDQVVRYAMHLWPTTREAARLLRDIDQTLHILEATRER